MSKIAEDLCAEILSQCEQAEHFKGLWLQANEELGAARTREAWLNVELNEAMHALFFVATNPKAEEVSIPREVAITIAKSIQRKANP